jgi:hypothetical protein
VALPAALAGGKAVGSSALAWQAPPAPGTDPIMDYLFRETRRNYHAAKAHRSPKDLAGYLRRQGANHEFMFVAAGARMRQAQKAWRRRVKAYGPDAVIQQIITSRDHLAASMKASDGLELPQLDYGTVQDILAVDEKFDIVEGLGRRGREAFDVLADKLDALANGYQPAVRPTHPAGQRTAVP